MIHYDPANYHGIYTKSDHRLAAIFGFLLNILHLLVVFVMLVIMAGIGYEIYHSVKMLFIPGQDETLPHFDISESVLKIIELLFLSSIPLLITTSFYKYYKKVIRFVFRPSQGSSEMGIIETLKSSVDVSMTKYNFYSILVSTGFIILFRKINERDSEVKSGEIWIYAMMVIGLVSLLYFLLRLKHGITESAIRIIKESQSIKNAEIETALSDVTKKLQEQIRILSNEKQKITEEILLQQESELYKKITEKTALLELKQSELASLEKLIKEKEEKAH